MWYHRGWPADLHTPESSTYASDETMLSETRLTEGAFVAVDIETTGCLPGRNGIIELGAARVEAGASAGRCVRRKVAPRGSLGRHWISQP